jgi:hypothetical protein
MGKRPGYGRYEEWFSTGKKKAALGRRIFIMFLFVMVYPLQNLFFADFAQMSDHCQLIVL